MHKSYCVSVTFTTYSSIPSTAPSRTMHEKLSTSLDRICLQVLRRQDPQSAASRPSTQPLPGSLPSPPALGQHFCSVTTRSQFFELPQIEFSCRLTFFFQTYHNTPRFTFQHLKYPNSTRENRVDQLRKNVNKAQNNPYGARLKPLSLPLAQIMLFRCLLTPLHQQHPHYNEQRNTQYKIKYTCKS